MLILAHKELQYLFCRPLQEMPFLHSVYLYHFHLRCCLKHRRQSHWKGILSIIFQIFQSRLCLWFFLAFYICSCSFFESSKIISYKETTKSSSKPSSFAFSFIWVISSISLFLSNTGLFFVFFSLPTSLERDFLLANKLIISLSTLSISFLISSSSILRPPRIVYLAYIVIASVHVQCIKYCTSCHCLCNCIDSSKQCWISPCYRR